MSFEVAMSCQDCQDSRDFVSTWLSTFLIPHGPFQQFMLIQVDLDPGSGIEWECNLSRNIMHFEHNSSFGKWCWFFEIVWKWWIVVTGCINSWSNTYIIEGNISKSSSSWSSIPRINHYHNSWYQWSRTARTLVSMTIYLCCAITTSSLSGLTVFHHILDLWRIWNHLNDKHLFSS